jgi:hypothetical protein
MLPMLDVHLKWPRIQLSLLLILLFPFTTVAQSTPPDKLAYIVNTAEGTPEKLYDPLTQSNSLLQSDIKFPMFTQVNVSIDGRLAFSTSQDSNTDIYILNTQVPNSTSMNITQSPKADNYPLGWSPDGRYLAFESYISHDLSIYIWNGESIINITPHGLYPIISDYVQGISWSSDDRLAFTVWNLNGTDPSEIYLWDGKRTTSVSQNPTGRDEGPVWNTNDQLAFLSARNGASDIFIWDGVSFKDNLPDVNTFINVMPQQTGYYSFPSWTNKGLLAFNSQNAEDTRTQVYVWNGKTATNISQNQIEDNGYPTWSADGRWAFSTFFSSRQLIYVKDVDNRTIFTVEGQYTPAWSADGNLAFCTRSSSGWKLSVWNGKTVAKVAEGREITAQWFSGSSVFCSSG